jgi:hypothetical protein
MIQWNVKMSGFVIHIHEHIQQCSANRFFRNLAWIDMVLNVWPVPTDLKAKIGRKGEFVDAFLTFSA